MGTSGQELYEKISIIPHQGLRNIAKHEYKGGEYTPLDMVCYKYWWDPVLNLIPLKMAPNLITILGFIFALSNISLLLYTNPSLDRIPASLHQMWGCFSFLFYTMMDAIDGRQARRTKSGSPLGQLLDHGCDSILSGVIAIVLASTLRVGLGVELVVLIAVSQIVFFIGQWEENHTGTCRTCVLGLFGTTEYLLSFSVLQISVIFFDDLSLIRSLVFSGTVAVGLASSFYCIFNVLVNTHRISTLVPLIPILLLNISFFSLVPSTQITSFAPLLSLTLSNSLLAIQMILSTVTKLPVNVLNQTLIISSVLCLITYSTEYVTVLVALYVVQFIVRAVLQISNYLNIKVFTIYYRFYLVPPLCTFVVNGHSVPCRSGLLDTHRPTSSGSTPVC
jgi:phosphatidylglycerophosphate synthase